MNPADLIAMAKEAGIDFESQQALSGESMLFTDGSLSIRCMTRFAELLDARTREACAKVCDGFDTGRRLATDYKAQEMAAAIRAGGAA